MNITVGLILEEPKEITPAFLECVIMPNGEIISRGKTVGWVKDFLPFLYRRIEDK